MSICGTVFQLVPGVQSYDWGIKGAKCRVAQFAQATQQLQFTPEDDKPYAELWMGTHSSCPSRIAVSQNECPSLASHLEAHSELIGRPVTDKFSDEQPGHLPFLFKVLSVGKALSIQAHPDKELGKKLHAERSDVYKDPNHKPEMAIALTPFSGFCGFRPLGEIVDFLDTVPEFAQIIDLSSAQLSEAKEVAKESGPDDDDTKSMLKLLFGNLMRSKESQYASLGEQLVKRLSSESSSLPQRERELVLTLAEQFPGDVGIFCTFLLNIATLQPGEALFLQANEPHAYLSGEILECMASSDNVVRAGLTPKLRDVETLVSMCTYQSGSNRGQMKPESWGKAQGSGVALLYDPPIQEFSVAVCTIDEAGAKQTHEALHGPSILLLLDGAATLSDSKHEPLHVTKGQVVFVGAETSIDIVADHAGLRLARAFVEA